jgi:ferritin-like metal-binding protein YciE
MGFQRGTHTRWQLVTNDASGSPTLVDMGASFTIATGGVAGMSRAFGPGLRLREAMNGMRQRWLSPRDGSRWKEVFGRILVTRVGPPAEEVPRRGIRHRPRGLRSVQPSAPRRQERFPRREVIERTAHAEATAQPFLTMEMAMAKEPKKLDDLFHDTLKDIYFAEKKILATLPKMAKAAQNPDLAAAFEKHQAETEGHVSRLEQVFSLIDEKPQGKTCAAIVGITDEGAEIMEEYAGSPALDAGLLAAAQAVEHYEISRYGTMRTWAGELGLDEAVTLLDATLEEEKAADLALTELAESAVNQEAEEIAAK